jgi:hypothetical protein
LQLGSLVQVCEIVCQAAVRGEDQFADTLHAWWGLPRARVRQSDCGDQTADAGARVSTVQQPSVDRSTLGQSRS